MEYDPKKEDETFDSSSTEEDLDSNLSVATSTAVLECAVHDKSPLTYDPKAVGCCAIGLLACIVLLYLYNSELKQQLIAQEAVHIRDVVILMPETAGPAVV